MTEEQINIAIAEHMGWKSPGHPDVMKFKIGWPDPGGLWMCPYGVLRFPRYCSDLNEMHEAEKALKEKEIRTYAFILAQILDTQPTVDLTDQFLNIHASALHRAEAFLKTIDKWEGS